MSKEYANNANNKSNLLNDTIQQIADMIKSGTQVGNIMNYSTNDLEAVYASAKNLYDAGEYSSALDLFKFLVLHNNMNANYWFAFGSCLKMLGEYQMAISVLAIASLIEFTPNTGIVLAECLALTKDYDGAIASLNTAKSFLQEKKDVDINLQIVEKMLEEVERIKKQKS